jgi:hypothetical protein
VGEPGQSGASQALKEPAVDFNGLIASLRLQGAAQFDPIGLHYLEVLVLRLNVQRDSVKRILEAKLKHALNAFEQRFQQAQCEMNDAITLKCNGQHESLSDLTRHLTQQSQEYMESTSQVNVGLRPELKSVRKFRNTWSKLSAKKQVSQALDHAPKNAGPINSHMLVLRSLALMREISPDYLNRFVSYVDTLLSLDQSNKERQTTVKTATASKPRGATQKRPTS